MRSDGFGLDLFASLGLGLAVLALLATMGSILLGLGMMFAPLHSGDPKVGAACMLAGTIVCGIPGVLGLGASIVRLGRQRAEP